ncbi:uncharacterized protein ATNIH1004_011313 [Aspergillus tanneri]|uniref:Uncharacterized protein n=1 Tax=Aspergillus tanneri TaxID=1220188 RepID=A0A5M9MCX1_9EURO|nr:uncharacterized protein ATNIH1004_011313 [Aspergillus tanneri]KAA8642369.1 hypothetical protein ATNIH1004_011313 [Aspergillus tanneri]
MSPPLDPIKILSKIGHPNDTIPPQTASCDRLVKTPADLRAIRRLVCEFLKASSSEIYSNVPSIVLEFLLNRHESEEWPNASTEEERALMPPLGKNWMTKFTNRRTEIESVMGARLYKERWNSATRESMDGSRR